MSLYLLPRILFLIECEKYLLSLFRCYIESGIGFRLKKKKKVANNCMCMLKMCCQITSSILIPCFAFLRFRCKLQFVIFWKCYCLNEINVSTHVKNIVRNDVGMVVCASGKIAYGSVRTRSSANELPVFLLLWFCVVQLWPHIVLWTW
jgi:hypothetical protein